MGAPGLDAFGSGKVKPRGIFTGSRQSDRYAQMAARERVTVIIPVRDRSAMIVEAINSVLGQTCPPDEILVVDDGSVDGTVAAVETFGDAVTLLRADGVGPSGARNIGLDRATGEIIGFLDSDDLWLPTTVAAQTSLFEQRPDANAVWGLGQWQILAGGSALGPAGDGVIERISGPNSMMFRRSALERLGGFNPALRYAEDHDLMRRFRAAGMIMAEHDALVAIYRRHGGNLTEDRIAMRRGLFEAAAAALQSRKAAS
jgi:glycosyltransferase involved in cell wall biosynthesis